MRFNRCLKVNLKQHIVYVDSDTRRKLCKTTKYIRNSAVARENAQNSAKFYNQHNAEFRVLHQKFRLPPEVKKPLPWTPYIQ
jgi:hypothetical protein